MYRAQLSWPIAVEFLLLFAAAPLLYFPARFQPWGVAVGILLLAMSWFVRGATSGEWIAKTPANLALGFWLLVMFPVAIWAAPPALRDSYSWPRAYILIWDFCLFSSVVTHASHSPRRLTWALLAWVAAAVAIALVAPLGMEHRAKFPGLGMILDRIPHPLVGIFSGAEAGFSTNQVAGALLYVLPVVLALTVAGRKWRRWQWWGLLACTVVQAIVMLLAQSRGGLLGLMAAIAAMLILTRRKGWLLLGATGLVLVLALFFLPTDWLDLISDSPELSSVNGEGPVVSTFQFRLQVWQAGLHAVQDFFFTGMGFGTFRVLAPILYAIPVIISPDFDLAHAHNFFLQSALDFGVPGFAAIVAIYLVALFDLYKLAQMTQPKPLWPALPWLTWRVLAVGWMGVWVGQSVYSFFDAVAIGSKPSFLWWLWLALIFAAGNLALRQGGRTDLAGRG
jgi:putative inorganic carbon (hco3(-)) transporter